jgi:CubicO group peptidase (beta-lactamase class C family)
MASLFPSTEIEATTDASTFDQELKPLPSHYKYKNNDRSVPDFLDKTSTTALLVVKGNTITYESYFQGTTGKDYRISWSTAKSFLSALFGIAVHEGTIKSIEEPVTNYVPELINTGYDGVRIKDVLQMSSGVHFNEDYYDFDSDINRFGRTFALGGSFDEFAATLVRDKTPGTYLHYVSIDTHVLGMVIRAATGRSIVDYFNEKLWSKIQPESSVYYIVDNKNEPMVLGGMNLRTRDFARFGQLYLNNGNWKGEQVVPRDWVQASITPDAPHLIPGKRESAKLNLGYGYQWWIPEESDQEFLALGIYGQYIYVNQKSGVVIVKNSAHIEFAENDFESATEAVAFFRAVAESI